MRIEIQGLGFPLTAPLIDHTRQRLRFALTRTSRRIKRVAVRLGDTNGPRGGGDKFCRVQVYLVHMPPISIEDTGADLYAVIERAAERAGRNVAKRVDRRREHVHPAMPHEQEQRTGGRVHGRGDACGRQPSRGTAGNNINAKE